VGAAEDVEVVKIREEGGQVSEAALRNACRDALEDAAGDPGGVVGRPQRKGGTEEAKTAWLTRSDP
jgi:hypothetical protein